MTASADVAIRDGRPGDVGFIVKTWRKCLYEGRDVKALAHNIDDSVIFRGITNRIVRLLQRCTVKIACDPKQDDNIVGFAVYQPGIGHFRYVREGFRCHGIASQIVDVPIEVCTHRSQGHAPGKMRQTYNPFLLEG